MVCWYCGVVLTLLAVYRVDGGESYLRSKRGASSISLGPPVVYKDPGNHSVEVGQDFQFYCKIKANPLAHVAMKWNPVDRPITVTFPKYGTAPTGGSTIVLLDLMNLQLSDEGRYTCFGENKYGTVISHGWLKFRKACNCNQMGVAFPKMPCDDNGDCVCRENVGGANCDRCEEGFFNFPFCQPCECNPWGTVEGSLSCDQASGECNCLPDRAIFDPIKCDGCPDGEFFNVVTNKCTPCRCYPDGSISDQCEYISGQCECKNGFEGDKCSQCEDGFYDRRNGCKPCECVVENTLFSDPRCDSLDGQCNCVSGMDYTDSRTCASCAENTYYDKESGECESCGCDPTGSERCSTSGECVCKENFTGISCESCQENHYGYDLGFCEPCQCNPHGTLLGTLQCDVNGYCPCVEGRNLIDFKKCDGCPPGQTISQNAADASTSCEDCGCYPPGSVNDECDLYTGECQCVSNAYGPKCDQCLPGTYGLATLGECLPCNCDPFNSMSLQCDPDSGQCPCYDNIIFTDTRTCSGCPTGQFSKIPGTCEPCNCNTNGSVSVQCDGSGQCACQPTVQGLKCDECRPGFYNFMEGGCEPCNCNQYGVVDPDQPCDPLTGQCNCKPGQSQLSERTCDGCPPNFFVNVNNPMECFSCDCHPYGSTESNCDLYSGQCDCGPNTRGQRCDECEPGFYGLNILGMGECVPCQCDPEGSLSHECDMFGQCDCKPGFGSLDYRTCAGCPSGMYLKDGECAPCGCDPRGSLSQMCAQDGQCVCGQNTFGEKCDQCSEGTWFGNTLMLGCIPCGCDKTGTVDGTGRCSSETGQCECRDDLNFLDTTRCQPCDLYQYNMDNTCTDCGCHPKGSTDLMCDFLTGQCPCEDGAYGIMCDACEDGYFDLEEGCIPCNCDVRNAVFGTTTCDENGQCLCKPGNTYTDPLRCTTCGPGTYQSEGECIPCDCHAGGSFNGTCDGVTGQCTCLDNVLGRRCDQCTDDTYGVDSYEGCKPCGCNPLGTVGGMLACDQVTGQCDCIEGRTRYEPRTCDGCLNNFFRQEYLDPVTKQCTPCDCHTDGSAQLNCTLYEGQCGCNTGIVGEKCDTIAEAQGDVVEEGDLAMVTCALTAGRADRTYWIGQDGCESSDCGHNIFEQNDFLSLKYTPEEDGFFTCRFVFGDVIQDAIATVDVITYELPSIRVQKGNTATLTVTVGGMAEEPNRGIEWRHNGDSCTARKCKIDGSSVTDTITMDEEGQWNLVSEIDLGEVEQTGKYTTWFKYRGETFRKYTIIDVYECNCDPLGSRNNACDPDTLQCECKTRYEGLNCDQCKDGYYDAGNGCAPCVCDPDNSGSAVCDKTTGQCDCEPDTPYIDTQRCEKCAAGRYLHAGTCEPCLCALDNTLGGTPVCDDLGQCPCLPGLPYVDTRSCDRCPPSTFLQEGQCKECGCYEEGSLSPICGESDGICSCKPSYKGNKCGSCRKEFYGPERGCLPCNCDPDDSLDNTCDGETGQCTCVEENGPFVDPVRCGACADNTVLTDGQCERCPIGTFVEDNTCTFCPSGSFFSSGACVACVCNPDGSADFNCDSVTGACNCRVGFQGSSCDLCQEGRHSPSEGCPECSCVPDNSLSLICNRETGQCRCDPSLAPFIDPVTCETCPENHIVSGGACVECGPGQFVKNNVCVYCQDGAYLHNSACKDCNCSPIGSEDNVCDKVSGKCDCLTGYEGHKCRTCSATFYPSEEQCVACLCSVQHTVGGEAVCADDGQCSCIGDRPYRNERSCTPCGESLVIRNGKCQLCEEGTYISNYECVDCECSAGGTASCEPRTGECTCKPNFTGELCDTCVDEHYGETCESCACSPNAISTVCDKETGACTCPDNFTGRQCELCVDGYFGDACGSCDCDPDNSLSSTCAKETGQCSCKPGLFYKDSRTCETCPHHHRVVGNSCVQCEAGSELLGNVCVPCTDGYYESGGYCTECLCNPEGTAACNAVSGTCTCELFFTGPYCQSCVSGRYSPESGCLECACDPDNSRNNVCDGVTGQCDCVDDRFSKDARTCALCPEGTFLFDGRCISCPQGYYVEDNRCRLCDEGYYLWHGECAECRCNPEGSLSPICDAVTGVCECDERHEGEKCQNCQSGYYSTLGLQGAEQNCVQCGCILENTLGGEAGNPDVGLKECDFTGQCYCKSGLRFVDDRACETCPEGQVIADGRCVSCREGSAYSGGICADCRCSFPGSRDNLCGVLSGQCSCNPGYIGLKCRDCADGYYNNNGVCAPCGCDSVGSSSGTCDKGSGQCTCRDAPREYGVPRTCFSCASGQYYNQDSGQCIDCRCNIGGSTSASCDGAGTCECLANVVGSKCDRCAKNHYGIDTGTGCVACGCNPLGVTLDYNADREREPNMSCHPVTGQCNCNSYRFGNRGQEMAVQNKYESRTCDGCPDLQYLGGADGRTCVDCNCHPEGSKNFQCDLYTGLCDCNPQIVGKLCNTRGCEWSIWSYGQTCKIEDYVRCKGVRNKTRTEYPSSGGDFSTITEVAECTKVETTTVVCRERNCEAPN